MVHELYPNKAVILKECLSTRDLTEMSNPPDLHGIEVFPGLRTPRANTETIQANRDVFVTLTQGSHALIKI